METIFGLSLVGPEAWAKSQNYSILLKCILYQVFCADLVILSCSVFFAVPLSGLILREFPSTYFMCWFAPLPGVNWIVRGPKVLLWHLVQRWGQAQVGFASLLSTCHQVHSLGGQLLGAVYHSPARQLRRGRDDNSLCLAACTVVKDSSSGWSHLGPKEVQVTLRSNPQLDSFSYLCHLCYLCYLYSVEAVSWRPSCLASALLLPPVIQQSAGCAKAEQKRRKLI